MSLQFVGNKVKGWISRQKKTKHAKISGKQYILPPDTHTYVCVSAEEKCSFFGIFGGVLFLVTSVLRFVLLPYCRRILLWVKFYSGPFQTFSSWRWIRIFKNSCDYLFASSVNKNRNIYGSSPNFASNVKQI